MFKVELFIYLFYTRINNKRPQKEQIFKFKAQISQKGIF